MKKTHEEEEDLARRDKQADTTDDPPQRSVGDTSTPIREDRVAIEAATYIDGQICECAHAETSHVFVASERTEVRRCVEGCDCLCFRPVWFVVRRRAVDVAGTGGTGVAESGSRYEAETPTDETPLSDDQTKAFLSIEETMHAAGLDFEEMCALYAKCFRLDASHADHATVKSCLLQAAEQLDATGMSWYVSTK